MADTTATTPTVDEVELNDAEDAAEDGPEAEGSGTAKLSVCGILHSTKTPLLV